MLPLISPALTNSLLPLPVDAETFTDNEPRLMHFMSTILGKKNNDYYVCSAFIVAQIKLTVIVSPSDALTSKVIDKNFVF